MSAEIDLEKRINIEFKNKALLKEALTHRSYLNEHPEWGVPHNERLEFLGDAVLELITTESLYAKFPELPEGQLTVLRAALVNYQLLGKVASELSLDECVYLSRGERSDNSKAKEVILANAMEALIGSIYLDAGMETTHAFVTNFIFPHLDEILASRSYRDPKSELQEYAQEKLKITPHYRVISEQGPAHRRVFRIGAFLEDELVAEGVGMSKQEAEVEAAKAALAKKKTS